MTPAVRSPDVLLEAIFGHAADAYPNECCGFLYGRRKGNRVELERIHPARNERRGDRSHRYLITPEQVMEGEALADSWGLDLVGVYHSHPDHPPIPSSFDREWALPGWLYLVVSVKKGQADSNGWWMLSDDRSGFLKVGE